MEEWLDYLINEESKEVIANNDGLIAFKFDGDNLVVTDFYVKEDKRNTKEALKLANHMVTVAKETLCEFIFCYIYINERNTKMFPRKVELFSKFGFEVLSAKDNIITMVKQVNEK